MNRDYLALLLQKHRNNLVTAQERLDLDNWYLNYARGAEPLEDVELYDRLLNEMDLAFPFSKEVPVKTTKLWPRIAVAAAAVAAITLGTWIYMNEVASSRKASRNDEVVAKNDIAPGKNGATITLANGKVIELSDAKSGVVIGSDLKYSDGTEVASSRSASRNDDRLNPSLRGGTTKQPPVENLTASTAKGQTYQFTLPDGTRVWLNADSKISFPSQFSGKERKILLDGEGYFEVVHNVKQPFKVESKGQVVEDIGTAFNINAYKDEASVKTTLVEGEARVYLGGRHPANTPRHPEFISGSQGSRGGGPDLYRSSTAQADDVVLKPNQQSILTGSNRLNIKEVDASLAVAWKEGSFRFKSETISEIMRKVQRWYDVQVVYTDQSLGDIKFSGTISRYENVSKLLDILQTTERLQFKIEGRKVYVSK